MNSFFQAALANILSEDIVPDHCLYTRGVSPHYTQRICFFIIEGTILESEVRCVPYYPLQDNDVHPLLCDLVSCWEIPIHF